MRRRFGEMVAASSAPWLAQISEPAVLEDLGEALLDGADGAAWLSQLESARLDHYRLATLWKPAPPHFADGIFF